MNINERLIEHGHLTNVLAALDNAKEWIEGLGHSYNDNSPLSTMASDDYDNYEQGTEAVMSAIRKRLNELSEHALKLSK